MARARLNSSNPVEKELPKAKINKESLKNFLVLYSYLKPHSLKFGLGLIFLLISTTAFLFIPNSMGNLIDASTQSIEEGDFKEIDNTAILLVGILIIQALFSYFRIQWFVQVAERVLATIRKDTYSRLITLPMSFFAQRRVGELHSRISADLSQIQDTLTTTTAEFIRQIIVFIGGTIALSLVSGKLTLLMLSIFPVLIIVAIIFGRFIRKLSRSAQDRLAVSNTVVEETLQGIANVKAFVKEEFETTRYGNSINEVVKLALRGARYRGAFVSFITLGLFGAIVVVLWYGSRLVYTEEISIGQLTSFILYSTFVGASMGGFAEIFTQIQKSLGATERVIEILNEKGEEIDIEKSKIIKTKIHGSLVFDEISFAYPSRPEVTVLNKVSFRVKSGERVAIVGPSGAGKSTISSLLLRFYQSDSGNILFDDIPADNFSITDIRNQIAIVPQDVLLFGGTIKENIAYGSLKSSEEAVIIAAKRANAHDFIMSFPQGYETIVGERGVKLSGGQRQRVAIARALLKDPAILILDEATSSLDSESERLVQEALEELMKNRTSIIIAHRLSTIREADKIIVLDKGHVIESGSHEELLLNEGGLYKYLSGLQFEY